MIPGIFFVPFKVKIPEEEIIAGLEACAFDEAVQRAYSQERNTLRSEKERQWGLRTYRPFRGLLQDAKPSFKEMLRIAEEVIGEIGMPLPSKSRGRRRKYDWKQILTVLLSKGARAFSNLERKLRDTEYCKVDGHTPCDSELHYVYSQISEEWLDKALKALDDKVAALYIKFDAFLNVFVVDGTGIPCDMLDERETAMEKRLVKETERKSRFLRGSLRTRCEQ